MPCARSSECSGVCCSAVTVCSGVCARRAAERRLNHFGSAAQQVCARGSMTVSTKK